MSTSYSGICTSKTFILGVLLLLRGTGLRAHNFSINCLVYYCSVVFLHTCLYLILAVAILILPEFKNLKILDKGSSDFNFDYNNVCDSNYSYIRI